MECLDLTDGFKSFHAGHITGLDHSHWGPSGLATVRVLGLQSPELHMSRLEGESGIVALVVKHLLATCVGWWRLPPEREDANCSVQGT